jgi:UDPglucose--hexose-1-phosphate uridylyltransferase
MPELRRDPISGRWVVIATERGKRPTDFASPPVQRKKGGFCPFCHGNEYTTPPEVMAFRPTATQPNTVGWTLRVMANKFPALQIYGDLNRVNDGVFEKMNGIGAHEVIVETPEHQLSLSTISHKAFEDVLWAYYLRMTDLKKDIRFKYILVFKNEGDAAGSSLEHTHSQLIALPIIPRLISEEIESSRRYFELNKRCIFCDVISREIEGKTRLIHENEGYIAVAPYAPRGPFETWILPKRHDPFFTPPDKNFSELASIFQTVLKRIDRILDTPPYNFVIHDSPITDKEIGYYHWHIELMPKLMKVAGFEWGSGFYINPTPPEEAAKFMREAKI